MSYENIYMYIHDLLYQSTITVDGTKRSLCVRRVITALCVLIMTTNYYYIRR